MSNNWRGKGKKKMNFDKVQSKCLLMCLILTGCFSVTSGYSQGLYDAMQTMSRQEKLSLPVMIKNSTGHNIKICKVKIGDKDWQEYKESKERFITIPEAYKFNAMSYEFLDVEIRFILQGNGIFSDHEDADFRFRHWLGAFSYELVNNNDQFELKVTGGDRNQRLQTEQMALQGDRMRAQNQQMQQMMMNTMMQSVSPTPYVAPTPIGNYPQPKVTTPKGYCARHNCHYEMTKGCHFCNAPNFGDTNPWRVRGNWDGDIK